METSEEYAQRRANETGHFYAVWLPLKWAAWYCAANRRAYAACGATEVKVFKPLRNRT